MIDVLPSPEVVERQDVLVRRSFLALRVLCASGRIRIRSRPISIDRANGKAPSQCQYCDGTVKMESLVEQLNDQSSSFVSTIVLYVESSNQRSFSFFQVLCPRTTFSTCLTSPSSVSVRVNMRQ